MTTMTPQQEERRLHRAFVVSHAEPSYRKPLQVLHAAWSSWNADYFARRLAAPHIGFGPTAPRVLGRCAPTTDYGGQVQITLNEGLMFGRNPGLLNPWPAEGVRRFVEDLLLRFTVQQFVLELEGTNEPGYRGFGPLFTREANRIGLRLRLPPVVARRRTGDDPDEPLASGWPHCVRPAGYYGDDVGESLIEMAAGGAVRRSGLPAPPSLGAWELLQFLFNAGRVEDARRLVDRRVAWLREWDARRIPLLGRVEDGKEDLDGSTLGEVVFHSSWLAWNDGTVRKMAESIRSFRAYYELPVLADALEEAGCEDSRILRHLRTNRTQHTSRCWVLRGLGVAMASRDGLKAV